MKLPGIIDPNAILRSEVDAEHGETFLSETIDAMGFVAYRYEPKTPEPARARMHFKVLATGMRTKCEGACL